MLGSLHKLGFFDNNGKLNANCYLVCLGDYAGLGPHGVEVFSFLLSLQQANPNNVFLLAGDHDAKLKDESDGFKKEFHQKFGEQDNDEEIKQVWQNLVHSVPHCRVYYC